MTAAVSRLCPLATDVATRRRRWGVAVVGVVGGLVAPLLLAGPAAAHDRLVSSTPGDGTTVEAVPTTVQLQLSAELVDLGAQVQITGPEGVVSTGQAQVEGTGVTQALEAQAPAGTYEVQWRVTSSDGHPISGSFGFTAAAAAASSPAPETTTSITPSSTPLTSTAPAASPLATPAAEAATGSRSSSSWTPAVLAAAAGGIVGVAYVLIRRRRNQRGPRT